ncbi:MAG: hypothetical protein GC134_09790 [Proteobacteria bacterium]|nr:hypothetical protein [Pseudomonadota bacterium]
MDPISRFFLSLIEDATVALVLFLFWYMVLHWVHDSVRGASKRSDSTFLLLPFVLGGGTFATLFCLYLYYGIKKAATGGYLTPWPLSFLTG